MDQRIERFLQNVEKQIYTEASSNLIRDELTDHIICLKDDYVDAGYTEDEAISKALLDMGDPKEIGYSFTDYDLMKKRKYIMYGLKLSSLAVIAVTIGIGHLLGASTFNELFPIFISLINVALAISAGALIHGHSMKFLELDVTPYLILWPTKERFKWEYLVLSLFFMPIILLFFGLYFYEEGVSSVTILSMWPILSIAYSIWAMTYSERYRIPKYMVVADGIVIKGKLVSWTAIESFNWSKDFLSKNPQHYKLTLNTYYQPQMPYRRVLNIHKRQQQHLQTLLKENI